MPRPAKPWRRKGRAGWYAEIAGKTVKLAGDDVDFAEATRILHRTIAAERPRVRNDLTVGDACDLWLDHVKATCKPETYDHRVTMLSVVCDAIGDQRIDELRASHVEKFLAEAMDKRATKNPRPVSTATKRGYVILLKTALRWTRDEGHWSGNDPLQRLKTPPNTRRERTLTSQERSAILQAVNPELRDFLELLAATGARPHLVMELEASHIDWNAGVARLESKNLPYVVILTEDAIAKLRTLAERYPTGPLLRNSRGEPWTRNAIRCTLGRVSRRLGIAPVTAYAYRHTFCSDLLESGAPPASVAALMNHKSLDMISRHYNHLSKRLAHLRQTLERFGSERSSLGPQEESTPETDSSPSEPASGTSGKED